jgi:hypothetical protein
MTVSERILERGPALGRSTLRGRGLRGKARSFVLSVRRTARDRVRPVVSSGVGRLRGLPVPLPVRLAVSERLLRRPGTARVPVGDLLLGAQNARYFSAAQFAEQTGDLLWASTPVADGPHAHLLRAARERDGRPLTDEEILASPYGRMALDCIRTQGAFFAATDADGVIAAARSFLAGTVSADPRRPILVAPIAHSTRYQVLDGHHRIAHAAVNGDPSVEVVVKRGSVTTPLQDLLGRMSWLDGARQLYQPVESPELDGTWPVVRRCTDRLDKMVAFLTERGLMPPATQSYLDIASCYGWFVDQMSRRGYDGEGMERDPLGPRLGEAVYGLDRGRAHVGDCEDLLAAADRTWDVVSCFSLLHHFVLGRGSVSHDELLRRIDGVTGRVLFLDTGQEHEEWFRSSLAGWDSERIREVLRAHTTFDEIVDLGPDADAVPPHERNYGRHLFACVRNAR